MLAVISETQKLTHDLKYCCMQMIFSILILSFTFKDQNLAENLTNVAETLKIFRPRGVNGPCFFKLQGPLAVGGARAPPSVKWSGGQDCRGKVKGKGLVAHCCAF